MATNDETPFSQLFDGPNVIEIDEHLDNIIIQEYEDATFICKITSHKPIICNWFKNGEPITANKRIILSEISPWYRLEIRKAILTDVGLYTIVARNKSRQLSSKAYLMVAPKTLNVGSFIPNICYQGMEVVKHLRNVKLEKGAKIELEATFQNETTDKKYTWFKNEQMIKEDARIAFMNSKISTHLIIPEAELADSGIYFMIAKSNQGLISSFAEVLVTAVKEYEKEINSLPLIEEPLPEEVEVNENEDVRMICKANYDNFTIMKWKKKKDAYGKQSFVKVDYGNGYLGFEFQNVSKTDQDDYEIVVRHVLTGKTDSTTCYLEVNSPPTRCPPKVDLKRPLQSVIACCGSRVTFDCSFALEDSKFFYVVWQVGRYRVKRTNSKFSVTYKGGEYLLYINKIEPDMSGPVQCELRKVLPNKISVRVNSSNANLVVVPISVVESEMRATSSTKNGKLFRDACETVVRVVNDYCFDILAGSSSNEMRSDNQAILEITYCRLDDHGLFFLQVSEGCSDVIVRRLIVNDKSGSEPYDVLIKWEDNAAPGTYWYYIELALNNGQYVGAGVTSCPSFEVKDVPIECMMCFRISTVPASNNTESTLCIIPPPEIILMPPKDHDFHKLEKFYQMYSETGHIIGQGAFGTVEIVSNAAGEYYAAKVLKLQIEKHRESARLEFEIMAKLHHPKLVQLMDGFLERNKCILVMDFYWGGELFQRVIDEELIMESDVVQYVRQLCEGLQYIHAHKIIHLDIKPENIVCLSPNSRQVKIIDFGLAKILRKGTTPRHMCGTRDYISPEVLNYDYLTTACDMWSLGVVTYVLLSGVMPFSGETNKIGKYQIDIGTYDYQDEAFTCISKEAKDFVDSLIIITPAERLTAESALNHKWIKEGPSKAVDVGMKKTKENLKVYLASYRIKWQRAANVLIATHRLRKQASDKSSQKDAQCDTRAGSCVT